VGRLLKFSGKTDPFTSIESGMVKTRLPIDGLRSLSVANITPNVFSVGLADISRPFEKIWTWSKLRGGMELTADHLHANPVTVRFELTFYGGEKKDLQVVISYT
jgi:hypothetical protein